MDDTRVAAKVTVEGVVQGVGFRLYTQRRASNLALSGYVINLPDGRVLVHAEGPRPAIEALVGELERGPRLARVARVAVTWQEARGGFGGFVIRDTGAEW